MKTFTDLAKLLHGPAGVTMIVMLWIIGIFVVIQILRSKKSKLINKNPVTGTAKVVTQDAVATQDAKVQSGEQNAIIPSTGKYTAMAFTTRGIIYPMIEKPLGRPLYLDPSIPGGHHGSHYLIREKADGSGYESYDPREKKFDDKETPSRCYKATHVYDLIKNLFANKYPLLDRINYVVIGISIVCLFFIIVVVIDKWK